MIAQIVKGIGAIVGFSKDNLRHELALVPKVSTGPAQTKFRQRLAAISVDDGDSTASRTMANLCHCGELVLPAVTRIEAAEEYATYATSTKGVY